MPPSYLSQQLSLDFQLFVQLILPLLKGDAAAASAVLDPDAPVVYLFNEVARTQLTFNAKHSGSEGQLKTANLKCFHFHQTCIFSRFKPVEVEYVVENLRVTVKEELVPLDNVVIT